MSMSVLICSRRRDGAFAPELAGIDPLVGSTVLCSSFDGWETPIAWDNRFGALIDAATDDDLVLVDHAIGLDLDAIVIVAVPPGETARGLEALRRGAHDFIETNPEGRVDPHVYLQALHAAIARAGVVIRTTREHRRMAKVLEHSAEGYIVVDTAGMVLAASPSLDRIWPDGFHDLATIFEALHPEDRETARQLGQTALENPGVPAVGQLRAIDQNGIEHWFEIRINDQSADPAIGGFIANVRNITDQVHSIELQRRADERLRMGFENARSGMAICEIDGTIVQVNSALANMLGNNAEELAGCHLEDLLHPESHEIQSLIRRLVGNEIPSVEVERRFERGDGGSTWARLSLVMLPGRDQGPGYLLTQFQDLTDQKESAHALAHANAHDSLTSLPNRTVLEQRLAVALTEDPVAPTVLFIDIDNFKVINDGLGHSTGDRILIEMANRLRQNIRSADTAARFGGDEFAVVLREIPDVVAATARAEHLLSVLSEPIRTDGLTHFVSVSIGVARGSADATVETVLRDADATMYHAKALGRGRVEVFHPSLHTQAEHRLRTATRIRHGLELGQFHVAYQPFLAVGDERVIGMEALLRWNDPDRGPISPAEFIPVAEQTGLILTLGAWALDESLRQLRQWQLDQPWGKDLQLSVNLSPRQLTDAGLVDAVEHSIGEAGVSPESLCLEITETAVMDDIEASIGLMRSLRTLGVALSIDDFGTGYSSLNYLKSLPLTTLKVDRSFIDGLGNDAHDTSIVEAVVALGHALDMRVHAEGVERPDQLEELRRMGCNDAQGWLWAPAMSADEFTTWVQDRYR